MISIAHIPIELPTHIVDSVFKCLDGRTRAIIPRICKQWNVLHTQWKTRYQAQATYPIMNPHRQTPQQLPRFLQIDIEGMLQQALERNRRSLRTGSPSLALERPRIQRHLIQQLLEGLQPHLGDSLIFQQISLRNRVICVHYCRITCITLVVLASTAAA